MKKKILILGIFSLFFSLLFVNTNFYLFISLFIVFSICFIYSKDIIVEYLKRLKNNEQLIKKESTNSQKNIFTEKNKGIKNILAKEIDEMLIKRKKINKEVIILEDKKRSLLSEIQNEEEIEKSKKNDISKLKTQENVLKSEKRKEEYELNEILEKKTKLQKELKYLKRQKQKEDFLSICNFDEIDSLDGVEFENFIALLLKYLDFEEVYTTRSTGDYGIDIVAEKYNIKYGIQCKKYSQPVGNKAIQEAYSGKNYYDCNVAIVATNNHFTQNAIQQARKNKVILWDRETLKKLINTLT